MFVIKKTLVRRTDKNSHFLQYGFWNEDLGRFGAECYATVYSDKQVAEDLKDNLARALIAPWHKDYITVENQSPDVKLITAPADAPQFNEPIYN